MKTITKKILAVLLSLLILSAACLPAFAESFDALPDWAE